MKNPRLHNPSCTGLGCASEEAARFGEIKMGKSSFRSVHAEPVNTLLGGKEYLNL